MPPDHSSVTVRQDIARAVLHSIPAVVITEPCADADFTNGTTFHDLVAPGQLLRVLDSDHNRILKQAAGVNPAVATAGLLSTEALDNALATATERERRIPGSQRSLLRAYAALAIVKQTALLMVHYGIRCAHLHLRHHLDTLPGLAAACKASAEAMSTAYHDVESGRLQDHPNQEALRCTLTTVSALQPGCMVLLLGDHRAFFTMYRAITDAGLRAYQLDRDGALLKAGMSSLRCKSNLRTSWIRTDLDSRGIPCLSEESLCSDNCALRQGQHPTKRPLNAADAQKHATPSVQSMGGSMPVCADNDMSTNSSPWSLVINVSADSLVRSRRSLHNALMQLEREGAIVGPAGSLPSILKERVGAQMAAVGLAYSTCILCFEGSKAFEPALLAYIEEVALLGKRSGVGLSVLTTTSPEETEAAVKTAVRTGCVRGSTSLAEQLTEAPSPRAAFLESFPSLNPFTAARLAALPCSMQQLLCSSPEDRQKLIQMVPDIPQHSMELFFKQASWGAPVQQAIIQLRYTNTGES
ncbi:hypothetical protein WJX75_004552 [Coccomyxa subellipsoidea]|uniref:Uncharacterized protein n=1 Tax=Coccomyxa subellipsoidea TaxID=248742 RepID=A0ABR2YUM9_9CHLO